MSANACEHLVRLLATHQERIYRYVLALIPHEHDARDVVQETCVALYRKAQEYDLAQPFLPWAYRFAYLEVLKHREKVGRIPTSLGDDVIELLSRDYVATEDRIDERAVALSRCLGKLADQQRSVILHRYASDESAETAAAKYGLSRRTYFRTLEHVRQLLLDCVTRQLAAGAK